MRNAIREIVEMSLRVRSVADTRAICAQAWIDAPTLEQIERVASDMRVGAGSIAVADVPVGFATDNAHRIGAQQGSAQLHKATVRMCIRNGITLPGISADRTRAIAAELGIAA